MREPTLLVLTSLAGGRKHGYGLIGDAAELSVQAQLAYLRETD